jgi:adenylate kinase
VSSGFGDTSLEMQVVHDLIEHHQTLFDLKPSDLAQEKLIALAKEKIAMAMKDNPRMSMVT